MRGAALCFCDESDPWHFGTYAFDGTVLTYATDYESLECRTIEGTYEIAFSKDLERMIRTVVLDSCWNRVDD